MKTLRLITIALLSIFILQGPVWAQEEEKEGADKYKTRRTPTLRESVYKKLAEAQELSEAEDYAGAIEVVTEIEKIRNLTSYEKAQMYNMRAFLAYAQEDIAATIHAYEQLLAQPDLPEALLTGSMYGLAQLYISEERYEKGLEYLKRWFDLVADPQAQAYFLLGQTYLLLKQYANGLEPLLTAIEMKKAAGDEVSENWYLVLRSAYYELGDFPKVIDVQELLIQLNPKKQYWVELSGFYSEVGDTQKQLHALYLAYRQGLLDRGNEYITLAQLLMQAEIPYRGSQVLQEGLDKGLVERDATNLRLLSQAYMMSHEYEAALEPLQAAAKLSDDGELYHQLASSLMSLDRFDEAAEAAENALQKGDLKREDQVHVLIGMARYNAGNHDEAIRAFRRARADKRSADTARQWLNYIEKEQQRIAQLDAF